MSDWDFLNKHRVTKDNLPSFIPARYASDKSFGFCGLFRFTLDTHNLKCIGSDVMGWQHVSVSMEGEKKVPSWAIMCKVKDMFWEPEDVVVQFHPKKSDYVNIHPWVLHLWRSMDKEFPTPPKAFV